MQRISYLLGICKIHKTIIEFHICNIFQSLQCVVAFLLLCAFLYYRCMGKVEDFSKVIKVVTELMDVTDQDILGHSRKQEVVDARWMVMYFSASAISGC